MHRHLSSPNSKAPLTSPRKVTHLQNKPSQQSQYKISTKITSTKRVVIEHNTPLQAHEQYNQRRLKHTKSSYLPEEETITIERVNSRIANKSPQSNLKAEQHVSDKENDVNFYQRKLSGNSSLIYTTQRVNGSSALRKVTVQGLFTTKQDAYEGEFNDRQQFHGQGTYLFKACDVLYEGQFCNGQIHGQGNLSYINPSNHPSPIYQGTFKTGKKHGHGQYFYSTPNHYYNGEWSNDFKQGYGVYESPDERYEGSWAKNKKHGEGFMINRKSGTEFRGTFVDDYFTSGTITYPNGDVYIGAFHLGKKQGYGTYQYTNRNQEYKGQFANDLRHGKGTLRMSNGDQFTGSFRHGRIDESMNCSFRWADGAVFNGWFKNGQPDKGTVKNIREVEYEYTSTASFIQY